jgi:hypothetical protein
MKEKVDVFNADIQEAERLDTGAPRLTVDRNFENGYDKVDTGYQGSNYGDDDDQHGDKRARFEA